MTLNDLTGFVTDYKSGNKVADIAEKYSLTLSQARNLVVKLRKSGVDIPPRRGVSLYSVEDFNAVVKKLGGRSSLK